MRKHSTHLTQEERYQIYAYKKAGFPNAFIAQAYLSGHYTLQSVGERFGVSYATVSRAVKAVECQL